MTVRRYLDSPLRFDEVDFAAQARGILRHGVPKLFFEEDPILHRKPYLGYPVHYGMWHPPVYVYSLALSAALGGLGNTPWRRAGLAWFLGSLCLGAGLLRKLGSTGSFTRTGLLAAAFLLASPLIGQGALHLDIDNTSLLFCLLLFFRLFLEEPADFRWKKTLVLAAAFTAALWSKLTTPWLALGAALLYHVGSGRTREGACQVIVVGTLGMGLFLLTYALYCKGFNYPADFMLRFTYLPKGKALLHPVHLRSSLQALRWNFVWISPPIALLLLTASWDRMRSWLQTRQPTRLDVLLLFCILNVSVYPLWGGFWGKYTVPAVFVGGIAAALWVEEHLRRSKLPRGMLPAALLLACFHWIWIQPLQIRWAAFNFLQAGFLDCVLDRRNGYLLASLLSWGALFGLLRRRSPQLPFRSVWVVSLLLYLSAANPILAVRDAFSADDRSPYRPLQERGFSQVVDFLNSRLKDSDVILCPKDVGFYFKGKHVPLDHRLAFDPPLELPGLLRSGAVQYFVDSAKFPVYPEARKIVEQAGAVEFQRIGDFVVYRL